MRVLLALALVLMALPAMADVRYLKTTTFPADIPEGFHDRFCVTYPRECRPFGPLTKVSAAKWKDTIVAVNKLANDGLTSGDRWVGNWRVGNNPADCNTYSVTKRAALIKAGVPRSAMRMAIVRTGDGTWHMVLVVSTTDGDRVLDNLTDTIWTPDKTGYRWVTVQDTKNPKNWLRVGG